MEINEILQNYRDFLLLSWPALSKTLNKLDWSENPYFLDEWMQANWELLVERQIGQDVVLTSYGFDDSARCRYSNTNKVPSYRILCKSDQGPTKGRYVFLCFTASEDGRHAIEPPFDYVWGSGFETRERLILPLADVRFELDEIEPK